VLFTTEDPRIDLVIAGDAYENIPTGIAKMKKKSQDGTNTIATKRHEKRNRLTKVISCSY